MKEQKAYALRSTGIDDACSIIERLIRVSIQFSNNHFLVKVIIEFIVLSRERRIIKQLDMYNYYYLKEYLPKRYSADIQQEQDREIVYAFKNGELSESIKKSFSINKRDYRQLKERMGSLLYSWFYRA